MITTEIGYAAAFAQLNIEQDVFDQIIADEGARGEIYECLMLCFTSVSQLKDVAAALLQYIASAGIRGDGGAGSGNFNHGGRPGEVGGSAPSLSDSEIDAIAYWKGGGDGWGFQNIRSIANGREAPLVAQLRQRGLDERAGERQAELEKITKQFENAVTKCPSADGKDLIRVTGSYGIPGIGKPVIGAEFELPKFTSFSAADEDERHAIVEKFGNADQVVFSIKGTTDFKDISKVADNVGGVANENEVLSGKAMKYRITGVEEKNFGGEWVDWAGKYFGGVNVQVVYIEPADHLNEDGGPGSGNFNHAGVPGQIGGSAPSGISTVDDKYFPSGGSWRRDPCQGWNKERSSYLSDKGHSAAKIEQFDRIMSRHTQYADVDKALQDFVAENPKMVMDIVSFEMKAAQLRRDDDKKQADKEVAEIEERIAEIDNGDYDWMGDREYQKETAQSKLESARAQRDRLDEPVTLYRKGSYDDPCLSFTTDRDGVTLYAGTDHEQYLTPDHQDTLSDLVQKGIFPIAGFGARYNFYAGESSEIVCVKLGMTTNADGSSRLRRPMCAKEFSAALAAINGADRGDGGP